MLRDVKAVTDMPDTSGHENVRANMLRVCGGIDVIERSAMLSYL